MKKIRTTFGKIVHEARLKKSLNIRECAALILKEDNRPISFQYLSDVENDRRNPPSEHIIQQLSNVLNIPIEVLYFHAEVFPKGLDKDATYDRIVNAYRKFVKSLSSNPQI